MSPILVSLGGRKFCAFLLLLAALVTFVMTGHLTDEEVIAKLFLGLLGLYAGANVAQKAAKAALTKPGKADKETP